LPGPENALATITMPMTPITAATPPTAGFDTSRTRATGRGDGSSSGGESTEAGFGDSGVVVDSIRTTALSLMTSPALAPATVDREFTGQPLGACR
jgi:hypothetical protein